MTKRVAVLGTPITHSLSPALHRAAYEELGLDWSYEAIEVSANQVCEFVTGCGPEWAGLSLTMPLKEAVLPALSQRTPVVELTQAANTVVFDGQSRSGHNTDVSGFVNALHEINVVAVGAVTLLGSGATARSALVAMHEMGAHAITVVARNGTSAQRLVELAELLNVQCEVLDWTSDRAKSDVLGAELVINTAPADVAATLAGNGQGLLFDAIYNPWPTPLASGWAGTIVSGHDLLIHQALGQIALMTGYVVDVDVLRGALPGS
ncbi:MAG: shikimate dehydrogenase [Actinomycetes bacterium]|jgi:shikimate dehydrogenase